MKLDLLNEYLDRDESVALAFLFGSRAKKMEREVREASDWDIGVYFKPTEYLELETEKEYPGENKIWADIVDILKTDDVDFVVLNRASPSLVYNVLRVGLPLTIKDKVLYLELLRKVSYEAMDWWDFVNDFWE
ncbi:MAG: nucleotidyltransferase domain-containing protein, partial [Candidatus Desantisbacteria bacterium]